MAGPSGTGLVAHELYFWHDAGSGAGFADGNPYAQPDRHPESPDSKRRFLSLLDVSGLLERLTRIAPRPATRAEIEYFHTPRYIDEVQRLSAGAGGAIGDSATIGHGSYEIALLSAGGCLAAVDAVVGGRVGNAYALVRPPGHHAEPDQGRGYCVFGNAVIAVRHAQRAHRVGRIAVVDWDVHHGNGTETAFIDDPSVLTISVHQDRCYPVDAGGIDVVGRGRAAYTNLNVPLPAGSGHGAYVAAFERAVVPALRRFRPELIVVASGLDANAMDPLGRMMCTSATYRELARLVLGAADETAGGRVVATHEGGYSNAYVPFCGLAVVETFAGIMSNAQDPYLAELMQMGGQALLPHQAAAIEAAGAVAARVPAG
ncbi:MAG TPA: class II histone deacetylase [Steroidobacteraceae bacterium]|nr:class II histone deacetylase [Steroidobacteraceae bacterium]